MPSESRQTILRAIRRQALPPVDLPDTSGLGGRYDSPHDQFTKLVEAVGGQVLRAADVNDADRAVRELEVYRQAGTRWSNVPGIGESNIDPETCERPHDLRELGVAVFSGEFCVAENGAVWVTDRQVKHRAAYFLAEHLVLIVAADQMVHNMHEAYTRLQREGPPFASPGYALFLSGPSKTADIEQSLVIGAQGPRTLHVVLLER